MKKGMSYSTKKGSPVRGEPLSVRSFASLRISASASGVTFLAFLFFVPHLPKINSDGDIQMGQKMVAQRGQEVTRGSESSPLISTLQETQVT